MVAIFGIEIDFLKIKDIFYVQARLLKAVVTIFIDRSHFSMISGTFLYQVIFNFKEHFLKFEFSKSRSRRLFDDQEGQDFARDFNFNDHY